MKNTPYNRRQKNATRSRNPAPTCGASYSASSIAPGRLCSVELSLLTMALLWLLMIPVQAMAAVPEAPSAGSAVSPPEGHFAEADLDGWAERSFKGNTQYRLEEENGVRVLRGETQGQASILYREQKIDLQNTPVVEWSWKVDGTYPDINERSRNGDDFPARLYVVAKTGLLPWDTVAINYVWSSQSPLGDAWPNPFTDKAHMVVVQTGEEHVGNWVGQRRNVAEDFKRYFDMDISKLSGYAVMVDGDNAERDGTAWFGEIRFASE